MWGPRTAEATNPKSAIRPFESMAVLRLTGTSLALTGDVETMRSRREVEEMERKAEVEGSVGLAMGEGRRGGRVGEVSGGLGRQGDRKGTYWVQQMLLRASAKLSRSEEHTSELQSQ